MTKAASFDEILDMIDTLSLEEQDALLDKAATGTRVFRNTQTPLTLPGERSTASKVSHFVSFVSLWFII